MAVLMSCTSPRVFCCISHNFCIPFCIQTQVRHPPAAMQDEGEDEVEVCVLCCQKHFTITPCGECKEHYCAECIDAHTCRDKTVY